MQRTQTLLLIRHAEAEHHRANLTGGWTDTNLTPHGYRQAAALAARLQKELAGQNLRLISSDLKRAVQTATVLAEALNIPFTLEPGLRDYNNGIAAWMPRDLADQMRAPFPPDVMSWRSHPGAESLGEHFARVANTLAALPDAENTYTLIVTHASVINCALMWWLDITPHYPERPWIDCSVVPTSVTLLSSNAFGEPLIVTLNDYAHLWAADLHPPVWPDLTYPKEAL